MPPSSSSPRRRNLTKMNSKALSVLASKAKSPTVRNNARNVLENRMNKALRVVKEQRHLAAKERWTRAARRIRESGIVNAKLREIQPMLKRYRLYDAIVRAMHNRNSANRRQRVTPAQRALVRSVLNENIPYDPSNTQGVLQRYYNRPNWLKRGMSNRNWAILFSTNPKWRNMSGSITNRIYGVSGRIRPGL